MSHSTIEVAIVTGTREELGQRRRRLLATVTGSQARARNGARRIQAMRKAESRGQEDTGSRAKVGLLDTGVRTTGVRWRTHLLP